MFRSFRYNAEEIKSIYAMASLSISKVFPYTSIAKDGIFYIERWHLMIQKMASFTAKDATFCILFYI